MKCWKCEQEIPDGAGVCAYCGSSQARPEPVTEAGRTMRRLYDRYGARQVLTNSAYLVNGLGDLLDDAKKLRNLLRTAMDAGMGRLYYEQVNAGAPDGDFDRRVMVLLTQDAGLGEKAAGELAGYFDEMIGWRAAARPQPQTPPPQVQPQPQMPPPQVQPQPQMPPPQVQPQPQPQPQPQVQPQPQCGGERVPGAAGIDRGGQYAAAGRPAAAPYQPPDTGSGWRHTAAGTVQADRPMAGTQASAAEHCMGFLRWTDRRCSPLERLFVTVRKDTGRITGLRYDALYQTAMFNKFIPTAMGDIESAGNTTRCGTVTVRYADGARTAFLYRHEWSAADLAQAESQGVLQFALYTMLWLLTAPALVKPRVERMKFSAGADEFVKYLRQIHFKPSKEQGPELPDAAPDPGGDGTTGVVFRREKHGSIREGVLMTVQDSTHLITSLRYEAVYPTMTRYFKQGLLNSLLSAAEALPLGSATALHFEKTGGFLYRHELDPSELAQAESQGVLQFASQWKYHQRAEAYEIRFSRNIDEFWEYLFEERFSVDPDRSAKFQGEMNFQW